jgi:hypothetical protein
MQQDSLLDHFVCVSEQRWRNGEAERLGGLEINHQLIFGRRLHRKVGRLRALENAIDVTGPRLGSVGVRTRTYGATSVGKEVAKGVC